MEKKQNKGKSTFYVVTDKDTSQGCLEEPPIEDQTQYGETDSMVLGDVTWP